MGGGGKSSPKPEPAWRQAGYADESGYLAAMEESRLKTEEAEQRKAELEAMQMEMMGAQEERAKELHAMQLEAAERAKKEAAELEAKQAKEAAELAAKEKRRKSLAETGQGGLLTGGKGLEEEATGLKKKLGA